MWSNKHISQKKRLHFLAPKCFCSRYRCHTFAILNNENTNLDSENTNLRGSITVQLILFVFSCFAYVEWTTVVLVWSNLNQLYSYGDYSMLEGAFPVAFIQTPNWFGSLTLIRGRIHLLAKPIFSFECTHETARV